jgi:hypothetical protein
MDSPEVETVLAWHAALNAGDIDRLVSLSSAGIEVGGPRGFSTGTSALREWVERAQVRLTPLRVFQRRSTIIVEEEARWRAGNDGEMTTPQTAATVFLVSNGLVDSAIRHPDVDSALAASDGSRADDLELSERTGR